MEYIFQNQKILFYKIMYTVLAAQVRINQHKGGLVILGGIPVRIELPVLYS